MTRLRCVLLVLFLPIMLSAQTTLPGSQAIATAQTVTEGAEQGVDYLNSVTDSINNLIDIKSSINVQNAELELAMVGVGMLGWTMIKELLSISKSHKFAIDWVEVFKLLIGILAIQAVLEGWQFVHQIPNAVGKALADQYDADTVGDFLQYVVYTIKQIHELKPSSPLDVWGSLIYLIVIILMGLLDAVLFALDSFGFVMYGIFSLFGPYFCPLLLVPIFKKLFWNWFDKMWTFGMYRAVAAAYTLIWSTVLMGFFQNIITGNYSIGKLEILIPSMIVVFGGFIYGATKIPSISAELMAGSGAVGKEFGDLVTRMAITLAA